MAALPQAATGTIELRERANRPARIAHVTLLFGGCCKTPIRPDASSELRNVSSRRTPRRTAFATPSFGTVTLKRPKNSIEKGLSASIRVQVVEVAEPQPPEGAEPVQ
jgi:hypothetical protein